MVMKAADILRALRKHYPTQAFVPELTVEDSWGAANPIPGVRSSYERRIDALMFHSLQLTAIEIKISRSDGGRETWAKVMPWRRITHRFVYAVPAGLFDKPPLKGCGLWWVHEDGRVEVKVKSAINKYPEALPLHVIQRLGYRASNSAAMNANLARDIGHE